MSERLPQLEMTRADLACLPPVVVATGYAVRAFRPGDEAAWCHLVNTCIGASYTEAEVRAQLAATPGFSSEDLLFAVTGEEVVGTAWARRTTGECGEGVGYLHMVAVLPERRGRRLGRALVTAALHRFREIGYHTVTLRTDDFRLAAIHLYLELGFRPVLTHPTHAARWQQVHTRLEAAR